MPASYLSDACLLPLQAHVKIDVCALPRRSENVLHVVFLTLQMWTVQAKAAQDSVSRPRPAGSLKISVLEGRGRLSGRSWEYLRARLLSIGWASHE